MALRINFNDTAFNAFRNLQKTDGMFKSSVGRLSSGLRVVTAADDPAGLVISESLRAQAEGLGQAIRNSNDAINMVKTAEGALNEVHTLLRQIRTLALHAANTGANDSVAIAADQNQIDDAITSINRIANNTQFSSKKLLDGTAANLVQFTGSNASLVTNAGSNTLADGSHTLALSNYVAASGAVTGAVGFDATAGTITGLTGGTHTVTVTQASAGATSTSSAVTLDLDIVGGTNDEFGINVNGGGVENITLTAATYSTIGDLATEIQAQIDASAIGAGEIVVTGNADNTLTFTTVAEGSASSIVFSSGTDDVLADLGIANGTSVQGTNAIVELDANANTITDIPTAGGNVTLTDADGNTVVLAAEAGGLNVGSANLVVTAQSFDVAVDGGTAVSFSAGNEGTVSDTSGNSVKLTFSAQIASTDTAFAFVTSDNSLQFQVGANKNQTVTLGIDSVKAALLGNGTVGFVSAISVTTATGANSALDVIDAAIEQVSTLRAKLGAFQRNTLESNVSSLGIAQENLQASESTIRDADLAFETVAFTRHQIVMQAATAMLAQANAAPQSVLQLLR